MKNRFGSLALGTLIMALSPGCDDNAVKKDVKAPASEKEAVAATPAASTEGHIHGESCDHDHAGPGKDKSTAIADKLAFLPDVLAVVDGKEIKREDFVKVVKDNIPPSQIVQFISMPNDGLKAQAAQFAKGEVEQVVMSKLASEAGYKPNAESVVKDFEKWLSTLAPDKMKQFEDYLAKQKTNLADYKKKISEDMNQQNRIAITTWLEEKIYKAAVVTDQDILAKYNEQLKEKYTKPTQIKVAHIPFRHDNSPEQRKAAEKKATDVLRKLRDGAKFEDMVRENPSSDGHLKRLGVLEFFPAGTYNGEFEDAAFALEVGAISNVVDTADGFQLIQLLEKKTGKVTQLSDVKESIKNELSGLKKGKAVNEILTEGKNRFKAEVNVK